MSVFTPVTLEEEEEVINELYKMIDDRNAHTGALLIVRSIKPISLLGGMMARFFLGPLIPILGHREEKWLWTLQMPENLEKLEKMLEEK